MSPIPCLWQFPPRAFLTAHLCPNCACYPHGVVSKHLGCTAEAARRLLIALVCFCGCDQHHDPRQFSEEGVNLAYIFRSQYIIEGSESRNSSRDRGRNHSRPLHTGLLSLVCSASFLIEFGSTFRERVPLSKGWPLLHHLKKMSHNHVLRPM